MKRIVEVKNIDDVVIWNINNGISFLSFMQGIFKENEECTDVADTLKPLKSEEDAFNYFTNYCELLPTYENQGDTMNIPTIPADQLETDIVAVFSTAHITESDNNILDDVSNGIHDESELMVDGHEYGFRVYIHVDYTDKDFNAIVNNVRKEGLSEHFCNLLHISRAHKANWMKLDCDGSTYTQLPTFEW